MHLCVAIYKNIIRIKYMDTLDNYDDITKFFYVMYDSLLKHKNQNKFACNLVSLLKNFYFTNFKNIKNIKKLTLNLKHEHQFAYKLCLLSYIKCDLFYKLSNMFDFNQNVNETKILELIINQLNIINNDIMYIDSFDLYSYKKINDNIDMISNTEQKQTIWEYETRNVIIQSLVLLVEHFTLTELKKMGVKIIKYSDTFDMSFNELSKYYNKQLVKIYNCLQLRKQYCESFIEVEKSFIMALINFDDIIYFDDFDIIVKYKDESVKID